MKTKPVNARFLGGAAAFAIAGALAAPGFAADHREAPLIENDTTATRSSQDTAPVGDLGIVQPETPPTVRPGVAIPAVPVPRTPTPGR